MDKNQKNQNKKRLRLERIGQTRWSSRGRALRKLFGSYTDQPSEFYSDLLIIVQQVIEAPDFKGSDRYETKKLSENLRKFETILMAFTFIRILWYYHTSVRLAADIRPGYHASLAHD